MAGILTKNTVLQYRAGSESEYKTVTGLQSFPDMGAVPEAIETTTLKDGSKTYIDGLEDYGDMEFECLYIKSEFEALQALRGKNVEWKLVLPDDTEASWTGSPAVILSSKGVNEAMGFKLSIKASSQIVWA